MCAHPPLNVQALYGPFVVVPTMELALPPVSLCLSFFICQMGRMITPIAEGYAKPK